MGNCEHLIDACAHLADTLLEGCTRLRILATSREALNVTGEVNWRVRPLPIPGPGSSPTVEELSMNESVRLFLDRARSRLPDFGLTPHNARAVATICRELDGIPLAIELSTARMGTLAVEQVAERLEDSLKLLTGGTRTAEPRQRTLRATLDWSHELLSGPERTLFRRLSVFAGGWTLGAAEAVGAGGDIGEGDVLDVLSRLVDKSLVLAEGGAGVSRATPPRYTMLEPVRQYGEERLAASAEAEAVRRRHASWFFGLAQEVEPWLRGARREVWLERLEGEYGNLRAALAWALERGEVDLGLWFGGALGEFWYMGGNLGEGRRWLEAALANSADAPPTPARIEALLRAGWIAWEQGDYAGSAALSGEGLALARESGDEAGAVAALSSLGWVALLQIDLGKASALAEEALALGRALGDTGGVARALLVLGLAAVVRQDPEQATALHEESLALSRRAGDSLATALSLGMGALAALGRGDRSPAGGSSLRRGLRARAATDGDERDHLPPAGVGRGGLRAREARPGGPALGRGGVAARDHRRQPIARRSPRARTLRRSRPRRARRGGVGRGLGRGEGDYRRRGRGVRRRARRRATAGPATLERGPERAALRQATRRRADPQGAGGRAPAS